MSLELLGISIVILVNNQRPYNVFPVMVHDTLRDNEIVPEDFEVEKDKSSLSEMGSQITYKQDFIILAEPQKITFLETTIRPKTNPQFIADIAGKFIDAFRYIDYKAIGINPKGAILIDEKQDNVILDKIIKDGRWKSFEGSTPNAEVKFTYSGQEKQIAIDISLGKLERSDFSQGQKVIWIGANIHHNIVGNNLKQRHKRLREIIDNYQSDMSEFNKLMKNYFAEELSK